ncbi:MAG: MFS transporter [Oscillospiraceae bacterium]|nr:MFS transporter [Oscillospiraceae bacterium]
MKENRWLKLAGGAVIFMALGLIYAWSIFRKPISTAFPDWSYSQISLTFTISMMSFCLSGLLSGKVFQKTGPAPILLVSALLLAAGFWGAAFMDPQKPDFSLILLYIAYGGFCGAGVGLAYNALLSSLLEWFPEQGGIASGILLMGFGIGGMLFGSAATFLIRTMGLGKVFGVLGTVMPLLVLAGIRLVAKRPVTQSGTYSLTKQGKTTSEMLRESFFWKMMLWLVILGSVGLLVVNSSAAIVSAYGGAEVLGLIVSVFNGFGRVLLGLFYDRFNGKKAMLLNSGLFLASGAAFLLGDQLSSIALITAGLALAGCGYGGDPTIASALVRETYGEKYYSVNFGIVNLTMIPSSLIGPLISSKMIEYSGGKYQSTFLMVLFLAVSAGVVWVMMFRRNTTQKGL